MAIAIKRLFVENLYQLISRSGSTLIGVPNGG